VADERRAGDRRGITAQRPGSPVTFCDGHRTDFATASGQRRLAAGIFAANQVVIASLRALHLDRRSGPIAVATAKETADKQHCRCS
jgi:hypothetical protein